MSLVITTALKPRRLTLDNKINVVFDILTSMIRIIGVILAWKM